ncbi:MAG: hypothetical protein PHE59_01440 [Patescibacteria group bacterium]|nr:hypothetical protein [Patescibacteria group bacterium]MDD5164041.1 hypothetical protein [Patescibacteria group bacterium]MDD5534875.1 hypothetical protein [Patescibacteria group bacterium]
MNSGVYAVRQLRKIRKIQKEQNRVIKRYEKEKRIIADAIITRIEEPVLSGDLFRIMKDSGNRPPEEIRFEVNKEKGTLDVIFDYSGNYLDNNKVNGEFIDDWVQKKVQERFKEWGMSSEYISSCIIAEYGK